MAMEAAGEGCNPKESGLGYGAPDHEKNAHDP